MKNLVDLARIEKLAEELIETKTVSVCLFHHLSFCFSNLFSDFDMCTCDFVIPHMLE